MTVMVGHTVSLWTAGFRTGLIQLNLILTQIHVQRIPFLTNPGRWRTSMMVSEDSKAEEHKHLCSSGLSVKSQ